MTATDWSEAERLWRSGAAMDEKLAMVERALAALSGGKRKASEDPGTPGQAGGDTGSIAAAGRDTGRKK